MVARCIEAISNTCHMEPAVKDELLAMGFKESEVGQAMRMAGGTSKECAVTWLMAREETLGGPEDEFEMVEDAAVDLPTMLISGGGLDCMAEMLQEPDPEVQASLWKAIAELTRISRQVAPPVNRSGGDLSPSGSEAVSRNSSRPARSRANSRAPLADCAGAEALCSKEASHLTASHR